VKVVSEDKFGGTSVACAIDPSVTMSSTDFSLPKPGFLEFFGIFQQQISLKNQCLPHLKSKSYQINSINSCSSRSFQQHPRHIPISPNFSVKKLIEYSRTFAPKVQKVMESKTVHTSLTTRAFQRHQDHDLKHPGSVDLITTKQTTFLHR
jgi:hypothetical protein